MTCMCKRVCCCCRCHVVLLPALHLLRFLLLLHMRLDGARNSGVSGGLSPVQKSTSYNLDVCPHGPTGRRRVKGGVSGPGRRFASCLRGGGRRKFLAGRQCTGAGCGVRTRTATRTRHQVVQEESGIPDSCHLDADWVSVNQWAGGRCAAPRGRGSWC